MGPKLGTWAAQLALALVGVLIALVAVAFGLAGAYLLIGFFMSDANLDFGPPTGNANGPILAPLLLWIAYYVARGAAWFFETAYELRWRADPLPPVELTPEEFAAIAEERGAMLRRKTKPYPKVNDWSKYPDKGTAP